MVSEPGLKSVDPAWPKVALPGLKIRFHLLGIGRHILLYESRGLQRVALQFLFSSRSPIRECCEIPKQAGPV